MAASTTVSYSTYGYSFVPINEYGIQLESSIFKRHSTVVQSRMLVNSSLRNQSWKGELLRHQHSDINQAGFVYKTQLETSDSIGALGSKSLKVVMMGFGASQSKAHLGAMCIRLVEIAQQVGADLVALRDSPQHATFKEFKLCGFRDWKKVIGAHHLLVLKVAEHALIPYKYLAKALKTSQVTKRAAQEANPFSGTVHAIPIKKEYIEQIRRGEKVVEGRLNTPPFSKIKAGDHIRFHYYNRGNHILCKVKRTKVYSDFSALLSGEGLRKVLPQVDSLEQGVAAYLAIPKYAERVDETGALAVRLVYKGDVESKSISGQKRKRGSDTEVNPSSSPAKKKRHHELVNRYPKNNPLSVTLSPKYIEQILRGVKTKEGRIHSGMFKGLAAGNYVLFFSKRNSDNDVLCKIVKVEVSPDFRTMLQRGGVKAYLPVEDGELSVEQGVNMYHAIQGYQARAARHGVVSLTLKSLGRTTRSRNRQGMTNEVWTS